MATDRSNRDDFDEKTKAELAKAANHKCSRCKAPTSGASAQGDKAVNVGKAAHICAAAPGGPRYDSTMTPEQRKSKSNGIWLCSTCADLIDKNDGADFPVSTLHEMKRQHEEDTSRAVGVPPTPSISTVDGTHIARGHGKVTGLDIQGPANIAPGTVVIAEGTGEVTGTRIENPRGGAFVALGMGIGSAPMSARVSHGMKCPLNHEFIGVSSQMSVGGPAPELRCSVCGRKMVPA